LLARRKEILNHAFNILEIPEEAQVFFRDDWQIKSVGMLVNLGHEKMMNQEIVAHRHLGAIALITEW